MTQSGTKKAGITKITISLISDLLQISSFFYMTLDLDLI